MRRARHSVVVLALLASLGLSVSSARAIRLSRTEPADRPAADPLRALDLAAILSGAEAPPGWREAIAKLPQRCRSDEGLRAAPCDDDLRCAWLAARADAVEAWSGGDTGAKRDAVTRLNRVADRLRSGRTCGREGEELERWQADRHDAVVDAARAQLTLMLEDDPAPGTKVLGEDKQREVEGLLSRARRHGVGSLPDDSLTGLRAALRTAWMRKQWLGGQPALSGLRTLVRERWSVAGGVPEGCGEALLDENLLADEWRGLLVRTAAPTAVLCLADRFPRVLAERGLRVADAALASRLAERIAKHASTDPGGRSFGRDPTMSRAVDSLARALAVEERAAPDAVARASRREEPPVPRSAPAAAKKPAEPPAPQTRSSSPSPAPPPPRAAPARGPSKRASRPGGIVRLANRVVARLGEDRDFRREAARARTPEQRDRLVRRMFVGLHHHLCAPLEPMLPGDRASAVIALSRLGEIPDERACTETDEEKGLSRLLDAAGGLERLRAAATLRQAARYVGLGREREALDLLSRLPKDVRGATWAVVTAWALRQSGDHVEASRTLASIDGDLLDHLRASGDEDLARLVAHAWVSPQR